MRCNEIDIFPLEIEKEYLVPIKKPPKPPKRITPSLIPAIEVPKSGASYNPAFEAHQSLLKEAVDEQLKKRKELKDTLAKLKAEQRTDWKTANEADPIVAEIGETLQGEDFSENEEDPIPEHVYNPHIPRKLQAERNKEARKRKSKDELRIKQEVKERKRRLNLFDDLKVEVIEKEKEIKERKAKKNTKNLPNSPTRLSG